MVPQGEDKAREAKGPAGIMPYACGAGAESPAWPPDEQMQLRQWCMQLAAAGAVAVRLCSP